MSPVGKIVVLEFIRPRMEHEGNAFSERLVEMLEARFAVFVVVSFNYSNRFDLVDLPV